MQRERNKWCRMTHEGIWIEQPIRNWKLLVTCVCLAWFSVVKLKRYFEWPEFLFVALVEPEAWQHVALVMTRIRETGYMIVRPKDVRWRRFVFASGLMGTLPVQQSVHTNLQLGSADYNCGSLWCVTITMWTPSVPSPIQANDREQPIPSLSGSGVRSPSIWRDQITVSTVITYPCWLRSYSWHQCTVYSRCIHFPQGPAKTLFLAPRWPQSWYYDSTELHNLSGICHQQENHTFSSTMASLRTLCGGKRRVKLSSSSPMRPMVPWPNHCPRTLTIAENDVLVEIMSTIVRVLSLIEQ